MPEYIKEFNADCDTITGDTFPMSVIADWDHTKDMYEVVSICPVNSTLMKSRLYCQLAFAMAERLQERLWDRDDILHDQLADEILQNQDLPRVFTRYVL